MDDLDALLADLQNTITPSPGFKGGKDHLYSNSHDNQVSPPPHHHHHHHHHHSLKHSSSPSHPLQSGDPHLTPPPAPPLSTSLNNNLNELDSLLQDLSSHKYPPPSQPVYATRTADLGSAQKGGYAPPPLNTTVKGAPAPSPTPAQAPPSPSPSGNFHPSANSTALVPSSPTAAAAADLSPAIMNGTLDSNSSHQYHNHYNGHTSVDSLLDELNASLPESEKGKQMVTKLLMEEMTTTTTTTVRPTASSATRELDDLMSSLSDFKVTPQQLEPSPRTQNLKLKVTNMKTDIIKKRLTRIVKWGGGG
uniref:Paxillin n=1 Tax=Cacopsylla melanoneura TaxID=428564 RepID=A0A8D8LNW8_9HEMI